MGVAYHANYLVWFEVGRTDWLRHQGWTYKDMEEDGFQLPVIEANCRYRSPVRYDDEVDIHTQASLVSPTRVRFDYEVRVTADARVAASGHTVHAVLGSTGRPCRIPDRVRVLLGATPTRPGIRAGRLQ
jgi:acyl-CoA thioester hydrolase